MTENENENNTSGLVPRMFRDFMGQLRATTERLEDLTRFGGGLPPAPVSLPLPGGLSATQMASIADSIAAQRRSIAALQAQLSSFDEQLQVLEQILGPLAQWSRAWADLEQRLLNMGRRPETEDKAEARDKADARDKAGTRDKAEARDKAEGQGQGRDPGQG